jgi:hypothetical protein
MRKLFGVGLLTAGLLVGFSAPALANDPHTGGSTGPPSQSCQSYSATTRPGLSFQSPGSPFNEPDGVNSLNGGNGGAHYSEKSQYDVACFQWAAHH